MIADSPETVAAEHAEAFRRDGYIIVRNLYAPDEMAATKAGVLELLAGRDLPESGVVVWKPEALPENLLDMMGDDRIAPVLKTVIGPNVEFLSVKAVFKDKSKTFESPWHQDWHYWKGAPKLSVWIALDDATPENGCLRLVPGSHTKTFQDHHVQSEQGFGHRADEAEFADMDLVDAPLSSGSALIFHDLALHSSYPNTSGADRWSLISTYRDASVKDDSTVWERPHVICGSSVNL